MAQLKLTANTPSEQRILEYLQNNASETLAEKINNGTPFEKDGKPLTNKKSLSGFMEYACGEARNLAAKDETAACVEDSVVYGWAIHYFEEDSIEGTLYTLDGSEYIPEKKSAHVSEQKAKTSVVSATTPAVSTPQNKQESLFDMLSSMQPVPEIAPPDEPTPEELQEALEETANEEIVAEQPTPRNVSPVYAEYLKIKEKYPDCIVAYRLGDFYEILGSDAVTVAKELDLTLTSRDCGLDTRVPMVGFPYHAADIYIAKIIERGHKIAVCERLDEIKLLPESKPQEVDEETGEILSYEEMKEFDGDIIEPPHLSEDLPAQNETDVENTLLEEEKAFAEAFDPEAVCALADLLGDCFILV